MIGKCPYADNKYDWQRLFGNAGNATGIWKFKKTIEEKLT